MPQFLIDHLEGCRPTRPCASCEAIALVKARLKPQDYERFVTLVETATGASLRPASQTPTDLNREWDKVLSLTNRVRYCLKNENLITLADIVARQPIELRRLPNFGKKSLKELTEELERHGLRLGMEVPKKVAPEETPATAE